MKVKTMAVMRCCMCSFLWLLLADCVISWGSEPLSYYQRNNDGSYRYGYNAGAGLSARQSASAANEVEGQYSQLLPDGNLVNVRYKAGVGGFRPQLGAGSSGPHGFGGLSGATPRPYRFSYNTGDAAHHAAADRLGNVRGKYWYRDHAGEHDLHYAAGPGIGFVPTGGSLAVPNGLAGRRSLTGGPAVFVRPVGPGADGSYGFGYANDDAARSGIADANGNVRGGYPYRNDGRNHDLPYVGGAGAGFQPTGGSLANPNGLHSRSPTVSSTPRSIHIAPDGSYSFGYQTPDSARQESADRRGNVHGSYSFRNEGGNHDLSFVAGPGIGFRPTGGSLADGLGTRGATVGHGNGHVGGFNPASRSSVDGIGGGSLGGVNHGHPAYANGYQDGGSGVDNHHRSLGPSRHGAVADAGHGYTGGTGRDLTRHEALDDDDDREAKDSLHNRNQKGESHHGIQGSHSNGGGLIGTGGHATSGASDLNSNGGGLTGIAGHGTSGVSDFNSNGGSMAGVGGYGNAGSRGGSGGGIGLRGNSGDRSGAGSTQFGSHGHGGGGGSGGGIGLRGNSGDQSGAGSTQFGSHGHGGGGSSGRSGGLAGGSQSQYGSSGGGLHHSHGAGENQGGFHSGGAGSSGFGATRDLSVQPLRMMSSGHGSGSGTSVSGSGGSQGSALGTGSSSSGVRQNYSHGGDGEQHDLQHGTVQGTGAQVDGGGSGTKTTST